MRFQKTIFLILSLLIGVASDGIAGEQPTHKKLEHLGNHHFPITTHSPTAQTAFDRGLTLAYSFAHLAAEDEFQRAIVADPSCAMPYWGIALVKGPYLNRSRISQEAATAALKALLKAQGRMQNASPLERDLIQALSKRYADAEPDDRSALNRAYATEMRDVWKKYDHNSDVATLFAESAMDVHPWDYWKHDIAQPWTPEIIKALEDALELDPKNPGANHFYIHILEASPTPERALTVAQRLPTLVPDSGHLQHMPGHIYVRLGEWMEAARVNRRAMEADRLYKLAYPNLGYERSASHNKRFCTYVAMMLGREKEALECARQLVSEISSETIDKTPELVDNETAIVLETLMRFGRWKEILKVEAPKEKLVVARTIWHFTKAVALTALGQIPEAEIERSAFLEATKNLPPKSEIGSNPAKKVLEMAALILDGEMAAKSHDFKLSISKLREAVHDEENLLKSEPPDWMQPVRHTLGAVLLRVGDPVEAERVYREDLKVSTENGWALMGLRDSLQKQGKVEEAKVVAERLAKAWKDADVKPKATCYCQAEE